MISSFDVQSARAEFPILSEEVHGKPLAYLDNGASSQKPRVVIDAQRDFFRHGYANIHRGVHTLSVSATQRHDRAREVISKALNSPSHGSVVFVPGATEALNLISYSWGRQHVGEGDEILLSVMEHHANLVPWQRLAQETGAILRFAGLTPRGELDQEDFLRQLNERTRLVAITHISNVLGTVNPVRWLVQKGREAGATVLIDGAQALPHGPVDLTAIDPDFYVFSGHKCFGPDGIGVLYGRTEILDAMPPFLYGGDMVERVTMERSTFKSPPEKFEAGTPNISGTIGLGCAFEYMASLPWSSIAGHEEALLLSATAGLKTIPGLEIQGEAPGKAPII